MRMITKDIKNNLITYFLFLLIAITGIYFGNNFVVKYQFLRVWEITNILLLLVGVPFLFFQTKAKLPDFWQSNVSNSDRFLLPVAIGIVFGILDLLVFKVILHPQAYRELPPFTQPFPYSILLFFSGGFEVEVFYRLIPLTLILLIGNWYRKGQYYMIFFWAGAILTAIREPLEQMPDGSVILLGLFPSDRVSYEFPASHLVPESGISCITFCSPGSLFDLAHST